MNGISKQEKGVRATRLLGVLKRVAMFVVFGLAIGWTLHRAETYFAQRPEPAGLGCGLVQGALMPIALPGLLLGRDLTIYAAHNTGRTYKLGYTMGVNGCGLIFFGFFFWRVRKLRRARLAPPSSTSGLR